MIQFTTILKKFNQQGEKTGWTYFEITPEQAEQLKPDTKVSFLVKGKLDNIAIKATSLLPMGGGSFIIPLKSDLRKKLRKEAGASLQVQLEEDDQPYQMNAELMACLADYPDLLARFEKLALSHRKYFSKWIESAKTEETRAKRIAQTVNAMQHNLSYSEMIRKNKRENLF